jgi:hypothetical protein
MTKTGEKGKKGAQCDKEGELEVYKAFLAVRTLHSSL